MSYFSLYSLQWKKSASGYVILPHPKKLERPFNKNRIYTLLDNSDNFPDKVLSPSGITKEEYEVFSKENLGISREFSEIINAETGSVCDQKALSFINSYGPLGLYNHTEDLDTWGGLAKRFKILYDLKDRSGAHNNYLKEAIERFNTDLGHLWMKPKINWDNLNSHRFLHYQPINLLSAMFIILAEELTSGLSVQKCENQDCFNWFKAKKGKRFCHKKCRYAADYKKRKK